MLLPQPQVIVLGVPASEMNQIAKKTPRPMEVAQSLEVAQGNQALLYNSAGQVVTPRGYRLYVARHWLMVAGLSSMFGVCAWQGLASPLAGVIVSLGAFGFFVYARQRGKGIERAISLIAGGNLDAAEAELARLASKRPKLDQWVLDSQMGNLLWLKGDLEAALDHLLRALPQSKSAGRLTVSFSIATVSSILRKEISSEVEDIIESAPTTPMFRIMRGRLRLSRAFHSSDAGALPSEDELHELGKLVLTTNRFGDVLALIAWAASERRDEDMATHWLGEANERLNRDLSGYMPEVHSWMQQRLC